MQKTPSKGSACRVRCSARLYLNWFFPVLLFEEPKFGALMWLSLNFNYAQSEEEEKERKREREREREIFRIGEFIASVQIITRLDEHFKMQNDLNNLIALLFAFTSVSDHNLRPLSFWHSLIFICFVTNICVVFFFTFLKKRTRLHSLLVLCLTDTIVSQFLAF